jgi:hypothetical protein
MQNHGGTEIKVIAEEPSRRSRRVRILLRHGAWTQRHLWELQDLAASRLCIALPESADTVCTITMWPAKFVEQGAIRVSEYDEIKDYLAPSHPAKTVED